MSHSAKLSVTAAAMLLSSLSWAQAPIYDATRPPAPQATQQQQAQSAQNVQAELYYQVQSLQREVMELRGIVEEQAHQLRELKQQSLDRYIDLDRRLGALGGGSGNIDVDRGSSVSTPAPPPSSDAEANAYRDAYELVKTQKFPQAIVAFRDFVSRFPSGRYAPNAWYWLGELYLVTSPPDLNAARDAFARLIEKHPEHNKVPDAKYKLGKVYFQQGEREKARTLLNQVVKQYGDTSSAAKLASQFLRENF